MPFNYNPSQVPFKLTADESGSASPDYAQELLKGFHLGMTPKLMFDEILKNKLANQIQSAQAKYAESNAKAANEQALVQSRYAKPLSQANLGHINAQTGLTKAQMGLTNANVSKIPWEIKLLQAQQQRALQQKENTFKPGGNISNQLYVNALSEKIGKNDERVVKLQKLIDDENARTNSITNRNNNLVETADIRNLTKEAKLAKERSEINQGFMPGSNKTIKLQPEQQKSIQRSYDQKTGALKAGNSFIYDNDGQEIGIQRPPTTAESTQIQGRSFFNAVNPLAIKGLNEYSGSGSETKFVKDSLKYEIDEAATKRIDDFILAQKLLTTNMIKENKTIGGANTNQVYKQLRYSLDSSDVRPIIQKIVKGYGLPKQAFQKADMKLAQIINHATVKSEQSLPALIKNYYDPEKYAQENEYEIAKRQNENRLKNKNINENETFSPEEIKQAQEELARRRGLK